MLMNPNKLKISLQKQKSHFSNSYNKKRFCVMLCENACSELIYLKGSRSLWSNLDGGKSLLCAVFNRTSAALSQVASSMLRLRLHQDLQLLSITSLGVLSRQWPTFHRGSWLQRTVDDKSHEKNIIIDADKTDQLSEKEPRQDPCFELAPKTSRGFQFIDKTMVTPPGYGTGLVCAQLR